MTVHPLKGRQDSGMNSQSKVHVLMAFCLIRWLRPEVFVVEKEYRRHVYGEFVGS